MRVVVTGASGYIGSRLVPALEFVGAEVVALSRSLESDHFRCLLTDRVDDLRSHLEGADHVIHMAGRLVDDPTAGVIDYYDANVRFTDKVLTAAKDAGVSSFVHASTRLVYPATLTAPAIEDRDVAPDTPYGISKRWAEDLVKYFTTEHGISSASLRIGQVTGGDHVGLGVINSFIRQARDNGVIRVHGAGAAVRELVHVEDVVSAIVATLERRDGWTPINVGGTHPISILGIAESIAAASSSEVNIEHISVESEDSSYYALDHSRALKTLSWCPEWTPQAIIAAANAS